MQKFIINSKEFNFVSLSSCVVFEDTAKGRKGAVLVDYTDELVPIVRTTTTYAKPVQKFDQVHYALINAIKSVVGSNLLFNNAMIEIYNSDYRTMKFHSDQSLDLAENSYIGIFSCYEHLSHISDARRLIVQEKPEGKISEILLEPNSLVLFSTETNKKFVHKIVLLEANMGSITKKIDPNTKWLGITFRLSKTFVKFVGNVPFFYPENKVLRLSTPDEKKEFSKHKGLENKKIGYNYPTLDYTISPSDLMPIN